MLIGHLYFFFEEMSIQVYCPFLNWVGLLLLRFKSPLYTLDMSPLSDMICKYLPAFCGFLFLMISFPFLMISLEAQIFTLMKYSLSIFYVIACAFDVVPKKLMPGPRSQRFTPTSFLLEFLIC